MHIAAANPQYVRREDVPADVLEKRARDLPRPDGRSGKPAPVIDKIVEGKLGSFYEQVVPARSAVDPRSEDVTIAQLVQAAIAKTGREHRGSAVRAVQGRRSGIVPGSEFRVPSFGFDYTSPGAGCTQRLIRRLVSHFPANRRVIDIIPQTCLPPTSAFFPI